MAVKLSQIISDSAKRAGLSEDFAEDFGKKLAGNTEVLNEYVYYLKTGNFLGAYKAASLSIPDIIVYQIDHFKAAMDQDRLDMKFNPDKMILMAFDKMLQLAESPLEAEIFKNRLTSESGTDGTESETERI